MIGLKMCTPLGYATEDVNRQPELFPNPSNGQFYLLSKSGWNSKINVEVSDLAGNVVFRRQIADFQNNAIQMDFSFLDPGIYLLKYNTTTSGGAQQFSIIR